MPKALNITKMSTDMLRVQNKIVGSRRKSAEALKILSTYKKQLSAMNYGLPTMLIPSMKRVYNDLLKMQKIFKNISINMIYVAGSLVKKKRALAQKAATIKKWEKADAKYAKKRKRKTKNPSGRRRGKRTAYFSLQPSTRKRTSSTPKRTHPRKRKTTSTSRRKTRRR